MLHEQLQKLSTPELLLPETVTDDYAATFRRVRPLVREMYNILESKTELLRRSRYRDLEDLIRYQSEMLSKAIVEHYYRSADQSGSFIVNLTEMAEIVHDAVFLWSITSHDIYDIANNALNRKNPDRGPVPTWMPNLTPVMEMAREIRHLARNALAARAIERKPHARELSSERVTDPALAQELWEGRQGVYRAVDIATAIRKLKLEDDPIAYQAMWKKVGEEGAFLERYDVGKIRERIVNQIEWVIFRAQGRPVFREMRQIGPVYAPKTLETLRIGDSAWGADVQIEIPLDDPQAPLPFSLEAPEGGEFVYRKGQRAAELIKENHGIAACVSDLRVSDEYAHMGFAGAVRFDAFDHLKNVTNRVRRNRIRFLIAEIFSVNGLYMPDWRERGPEAYLALETPLSNIASQIAHTHGRTPAYDGWERKGEKIPVWLPGDAPDRPHYLDVSWMAMIHDLLLVDEHADSAR